MAPVRGDEIVVPDTPSDSSYSPDKKRKKLIYPQNARLDKGKKPVSFRAASRINEFDISRENSSSYYKNYPKNNVEVVKPATLCSEYILLEDEIGKEKVTTTKVVGCPSLIEKSKLLSLNTRTTLASFHDALLKLNSAQKNAIRDTGFGNMLDLKVKELPGRLAYWTLKIFNPKTCELEISSTFRVKVTKDDVYRVFGLPKGVKRINRFDRQTINELFEEWFDLFGVENRDKIKIGLVLQEMINCKDGGLWFKRHFMIAMCFCLFESFSNGTVHPHILNTLFDVENLDKWDWAEYMLRSLVENRENWGGDDSKMYTGPSLFLVLFYVDRINISGVIPRRLFPILMNWSSNALRERQRIEMKRPKFGIGRLREPLKLPDRYSANSKHPLRCEGTIGVVDDFIISKKLREDARYIADRMAQLSIIAKSASMKEKQSKFFKDSIDEVFKLTGVRIVIDEPKFEIQPAVFVDLEDDIVYPDEFFVWMDATSAESLSKQQSIKPNKVEIPSFNLCTADEEVVFLSEVPGSFDTPPSSSKQRAVENKFRAGKMSSKENQVYDTPAKVSGYGNKMRTALLPLDHNSSDLVSDVTGGDSPILGCVRKDLPVKKLNYRANDIDNIVCNRTPLSSKEKAIAMHCMHSDFVDDGKVLFMFKDIELSRYDLQSMRRGSVVQPSVINAWSTILNHVPIFFAANKPIRFFASTDIYIDCIYQPGMSYVARQRTFFDALDRELRLYQSNALGFIDMFFFPVFPDDQPYVLCFDLRKELMFIIDFSVELNKHPVGSNYDLLCDVFRSLLSEFLHNNGEDLSAASVANSTILVVELKWADMNNKIDASLYLMRHMETFEGDTSSNWKNGLLNATQRQLCLLRLRYLATIILWDKNKVKDEVLRDSSATYCLELADNAANFDVLLTG